MTALSLKYGHATFGDVGRMGYAWFFNGVPFYIDWQGGPPGSGIPVHPTRKLESDPGLYEFKEPFQVTYPPWYDPAYWYMGLKIHPNLGAQLNVAAHNITSFFDLILMPQLGLTLGAILGLLFAAPRPIGRRWRIDGD